MHPLNASPAAAPTTLSIAVVRAFSSSWRGRRCRTVVGPAQAVPLLYQVFAHVQSNCAGLSAIRRHSACDLYGAGEWDTFPKGVRVCAGICLAFLVNSGHLPLKVHWTPSGRGKRYYLLLPGSQAPATAMTAQCPQVALGPNNPPDDGVQTCPY